MKKIFALVLLGMTLVGCGSTETVDVSSYEQKISELEKQLEEANSKIAELEASTTTEKVDEVVDVAEQEGSNSIKGLTVAVTNMEALTIDTYEGQKDVLKVDFDFTNNSQEAATFDGVLDMKAFQDAVELSKVFSTATTGEAGDNSFKEVRPGGTITISVLFETKSKTPIELEVSELFSFDDQVVKLGTYEFK